MSQFTVSKPEVEDEPVTSPVYLRPKVKSSRPFSMAGRVDWKTPWQPFPGLRFQSSNPWSARSLWVSILTRIQEEMIYLCWISFLFWSCAPGHHRPLQLWDNHPCIGLRHHDGWPYLRPKPELHWSQEATKERCHLSTDSVPSKEEQTREMSPEFEERTW